MTIGQPVSRPPEDNQPTTLQIPQEGETVGADRRNELLLLEDQNCRRLFRPDDFEPLPAGQCDWRVSQSGIRLPVPRWVYRPEDPDESTAEGWMSGYRAAWVSILRTAMGNLGEDLSTEDELRRRLASMLAEREGAVAALRDLCRTHGDLDWEPSLHLGEVIEKHLADHLQE